MPISSSLNIEQKLCCGENKSPNTLIDKDVTFKILSG